ncbi:TonB-dependent receptor plug domain-containing protein, partial [Burkholderia pseudomallei]|uniref:TonB-dependent receptor plug domain-containing protein n=1 Tax=Burkholderia pseudomallei TaxID=28450 RepID=UPI003F685869
MPPLPGAAAVLKPVARATGFSTAAAPGNGGTAPSVRGSAGQESGTTLVDGVRPYPGAGAVPFPFSTWSGERTEVLRGRAAVLLAAGAVGGGAEGVTRRPA